MQNLSGCVQKACQALQPDIVLSTIGLPTAIIDFKNIRSVQTTPDKAANSRAGGPTLRRCT
ncbi:hypothetical protein OBV_07740 [Oscillibacter valericigenes Sjm18-20]|nr:hypothetical protein OBV_07740 [Oscillibacter valericigenes Sjm18-20]